MPEQLSERQVEVLRAGDYERRLRKGCPVTRELLGMGLIDDEWGLMKRTGDGSRALAEHDAKEAGDG